LKKQFFFFCLVCLVLNFANLARAQVNPNAGSNSGPNAGIDQLRQFIKNSKTAEGEFVQQQLRSPKANEPPDKLKVIRQTSGKFLFQRPGKFVWDTQKPYEQKLLADGKLVTMWDKDLNQVTIRSAGQALASTPAAILFGESAIDDYFDLEEAGERNELRWVNLKPKTKAADKNEISYTKIAIGMGNGLPRGLELIDGFGNVVLVVFGSMQLNVNITPGRFVFTPPAGAEVLRLN
jgi:outer membrane lipoprotein carrier protein